MYIGKTLKRLFILTDWFAPGYKAGGPIQSCVNLAFALKESYDIYVYTSDTDHGEKEPYQNIESDKWIKNLAPDIHVYYANSKTSSFANMREQINQVKPDYIYLNHMFSPRYVLYPLWLKLTGFIKCEVILCPRGALFSSALSVKSYKKKPFLILFKFFGIHQKIRFHATNQKEQEAIRNFFPNSVIAIANNLPVMQQNKLVVTEKKAGTLKMIFVARIHPIKNLLFLLQCMQNIKSEVSLTVIGPLEDRSYRDQCDAEVRKLPPDISVTYMGAKQNNEIESILLQHHLFVLPTKGENFGHSIFESFNAGRPVLISDQTPWQNLQDEQAGWSLPLSEPDKFSKAIEEAAQWDQQTFNHYCEQSWNYAKAFTSNPQLISPYYQLFS
jgi:glycosyltransferase involved in cell wall biosynthesis